jgi:hypothetical protein
MTKRSLLSGVALLMVMGVTSHALAQNAPASPTAPSPPAPTAAPVPPRATVGTAAGAAPRNIRFDISIADSGVTTPINKTVTLNVSQGGNGSIRSSAPVPGLPSQAPRTDTTRSADGKESTSTLPMPMPTISLNVDVSNPVVYEDGGIRAMVVIEYQPRAAGGSAAPQPAIVRANSISVFESGKKMVLLQAADPLSDRRTTIEVTATVVR